MADLKQSLPMQLHRSTQHGLRLYQDASKDALPHGPELAKCQEGRSDE
jgi:hypothetical protein